MSGPAGRPLPRKILVVGLGNPDRGDDGVGTIVAEKLMHRLPPDVPILLSSGDMLSLIDDWTGFDALVCVDAAAPMGVPGRIRKVDLVGSILPHDTAAMSSHGFGIAETIALARALGRAPRDIIIYAVEGCCFTSGAALTAEVAAAASDAADRVVAEVARLQQRLMQRPSGSANASRLQAENLAAKKRTERKKLGSRDRKTKRYDVI
jgi:hydrogenase maturation protease